MATADDEGAEGDAASSRAGELLEAFSRFDRAMHMGNRRSVGMATKPGQLWVLFCLKRRGATLGQGLRVSEIAAELGVTPSSVTQIVTELESNGLVVRSMDAADRRAVRVSLTDSGQRLTEEFHRPYMPVMNELALSLGDEKCQTLIDLLSEVDGFFVKRRDADACPGCVRQGEAPQGDVPSARTDPKGSFHKEHQDQ